MRSFHTPTQKFYPQNLSTHPPINAKNSNPSQIPQPRAKLTFSLFFFVIVPHIDFFHNQASNRLSNLKNRTSKNSEIHPSTQTNHYKYCIFFDITFVVQNFQKIYYTFRINLFIPISDFIHTLVIPHN